MAENVHVAASSVNYVDSKMFGSFGRQAFMVSVAQCVCVAVTFRLHYLQLCTSLLSVSLIQQLMMLTYCLFGQVSTGHTNKQLQKSFVLLASCHCHWHVDPTVSSGTYYPATLQDVLL